MGLKNKLIRKFIGNRTNREYERLIILQAQAILNQNRRLDLISDLSDVQVSAFSQWGEDGIIDLVQNAEIALNNYEVIYSPEWAAGRKVIF